MNNFAILQNTNNQSFSISLISILPTVHYQWAILNSTFLTWCCYSEVMLFTSHLFRISLPILPYILFDAWRRKSLPSWDGYLTRVIRTISDWSYNLFTEWHSEYTFETRISKKCSLQVHQCYNNNVTIRAVAKVLFKWYYLLTYSLSISSNYEKKGFNIFIKQNKY